eukprot:TRINITY_DN10441_c0_g1_i1.p1 TRINITY_DN10441_c0_g1~~TRINITY_DN10441_c0_g1_i1.p1  ORF type:complete len:260 (-),score=28.45 TRINITY_DN10441_c0_g1_i1:203-982(-)
MDTVYTSDVYRIKGKPMTNPLLVRPQTGKVRPTTYSLPHSDFIYGKIEASNEEGAKEVVNSWHEHKTNAASAPPRNFVRLNKQALTCGASNPKSIDDFRSTHDCRMRLGPAPKPKDRVVPNQTITYGRPSKYTTGVDLLVSNSYQREAILRRHNQEEIKAETKRPSKFQPMHTKASLGHHKVKVDSQSELYKLPQFKSATSRVVEQLAVQAEQQQFFDRIRTNHASSNACAVATNNYNAPTCTTEEATLQSSEAQIISS